MKRITPTLACIAAILLAAACEDSQARRRAEVQQIIVDEGLALDRAAAQLTGPERRGELQQTLKQVIRALGDTSDGTAGQRAAAAQIASAAHRRLAWISQEQAAEIESSRRAQRSTIDGMINLAARLDALAAGLEAIDTGDLRDDLTQTRRETEQALAIYSEQMAGLDGPIADGNLKNREDRQAVEQIRTQAGDLRREAADLGPFEGYSMQQRALELDRRADRIEYDIAQREIELRYTTEAEHRQAENNVELIRERIDAIDGARVALEELSADAQRQAQTTRFMLGEIRDTITEALAELDQSSSELDELYEQAVTELDRAADKAKSAVNWVRGDADAADTLKLEAAQVFLQLGRVHAARARGLDGQAALLERLAQSGAGGMGGNPAALHQTRQEASGQAQAAFANARGMLDQVSGRTARAELEQLKASLTRLESAAGGEPVVMEEAKPSAPPPGPAAAPPAPTTGANMTVLGPGAESPDALAAFVESAGDPNSMITLVHDYSCVELRSPDEERFYKAAMDANRAMMTLDKAMKDQFGTGFMEMAGQMMPGGGGFGMPDMSGAKARLGPVKGDRGTIEVTAGGVTETSDLVRINGRWYVDVTQFIREMIDEAGPAMGPQAAGMMTAMTQASNELADRVRAGELGSPQEVMMAFGQAMQGIGGPGSPGS